MLDEEKCGKGIEIQDKWPNPDTLLQTHSSSGCVLVKITFSVNCLHRGPQPVGSPGGQHACLLAGAGLQ